jgi:hypothetical protein
MLTKFNATLQSKCHKNSLYDYGQPDAKTDEKKLIDVFLELSVSNAPNISVICSFIPCDIIYAMAT